MLVVHISTLSFSMQSQGTTQCEARYINKSLSFLEQVTLALTERNRDHIPYRQTKLTHILKDSVGGNCSTVMIANIWVEIEQIEETVSAIEPHIEDMSVKSCISVTKLA